MLTFFCLSVVIAVLAPGINSKRNQVEAAESVWALEKGDIENQYEKYDVFTISAYSTLQYFAGNVNAGYTYAGKTVRLLGNIDCGGNSVGIGGGTASSIDGSSSGSGTLSFLGTFDGNGYTISNVSYSSYHESKSGQTGGGWITIWWYYYSYSLFNHIGASATIKNLKVSNVGRSSLSGYPSGQKKTKYIAGLVGTSLNATILNCMVENFNVTTTDTTSTINVAGIVARGSAEITNCHVKNMTVNECNDLYGLSPAGTIQTSVVQNVQYGSNSYTPTISAGTVTNCKTTAKDVSGLSYSSEGGKEVSNPWYYGGSGYNGGCPYLRCFMNWKTINFSVNESSAGSVSQTSILVPSDSNPTATKSGATIAILGQTSTATASSGYQFSSWTGSGTSYTANFNLNIYTLTFSNATGVASGDSAISPSGASYQVYHGTTISASPTSGDGPLTLTYTFNNTSGTSCNITYSIPAKYRLTNVGDVSTIESDGRIIQPTVELRTYKVTLKASSNSNRTFDTIWTVNYGDTITYDSENISFTYSGDTVIYTPNSDYRFDSLVIKKDGNLVNTSALSNILGDIEIQPIFARWWTVTFVTIDNTTAPTSVQTITVREDDTIVATLSSNKKTLTYSYNGTNVDYSASQYYILSNGNNNLTITKEHSKTITPETEFYACLVTMGGINSSVGTRSVIGDSYETANDGVFVVEFGTTVTFALTQANGIFTYTYTFSSGQAVTYTMKNNQYAMQYILDDGKRVGIYNGLNGEINTDNWSSNTDSYKFPGPDENTSPTSKTISPTFGKKQYAGQLG